MYYNVKHEKPFTYKEDDFVLIRDSTLKLDDDKKLKSNYKGIIRLQKFLIEIDL